MKIKPEDLKNYIGKKIRTTLMGNKDGKHFVGFDSDGNVVLQDYIGGYSVYSAGNPWETYEEPKKKVKMWQWVFRGSTGVYKGNHYFKSQEDAKKAYFDVELLQRADWTQIEVEE